MAQYKRCEVYSPSAELLWVGEHHRRSDAIKCIDPRLINVALGNILGCGERIDGSKSPTESKILEFAIDQEFISTKNNAHGFITALPKAKIIQRVVEAINEEHYQFLDATEISFPIVYDNSSEELNQLTHSYDSDARIFAVESKNENLRLAYAADPGLFLWLKNKMFKKGSLPYSISTELNVFRKYKSGELGGFPTLREFPMPDIHIICNKSDALNLMCSNLNFASKKMQRFFNGTWIFSMDIVEELLEEIPHLLSDVCKAVNSICVINVLKEKPRYYSIKTVFMMDAGERSIMNYNMQWDEVNPQRFNISSEEGEPLVVLHGTLMHSWYKILPVYINKHLTYQTNELLPVCFSPVQVALIPLNQEHYKVAEKIKNDFNRLGIRGQVIKLEKTLSKTLSKIKKRFIPYFLVVGDSEIRNDEYFIKNISTQEKINSECFKDYLYEQNGDLAPFRIGRCDLHQPFVG
jgi:threonyl-tRNA synthetase